MGIQEIRGILSVSNLFVIIMTILTGLFLWDFLSDPLGMQLNVFFRRTEDFQADFFNVQRYISEWDPYHNTINGLGEKCYLPFTYLLLELFNGFYDYSGATLQECYSSSTAMLSCFLFLVLSVLIFFHSFNCLIAVSTLQKVLILFSSVMLFSLERGNLIILCIALFCYYLAFMNSPVRWKRVFALTCLCILSVIKIYPVVFGLYLLKAKRFKAIAFCVILSLLLVFLPFMFFKGQFDNINQLFTNLAVFAQTYNPGNLFPRFGLTPLLFSAMSLLQKSVSDSMVTFPTMLTACFSVVSLVLFFFERTPWKQMALLVLPLLMYPTNSAFYCGLYMFPVLFLFIREKNRSMLSYVYLLLFCMLFNPLQIAIDETAVSWMVSNMVIALFWLLLIVDVSWTWTRSASFHLTHNRKQHE